MIVSISTGSYSANISMTGFLMRRQKRDKNQRAFVRGYQVGRLGKSKELCPFQVGETRQTWISGWRNGREDHWDGFTGAAGIARQPTQLRL